jgi:hypothetical protein
MVENLGKLPSKRGPISKIRLSDGCGGGTITMAAKSGYHRYGLESYLGNVY